MSKFDFDIVAIGGGAAGLTASGICASFGAKTALIEKDRLGGDCTWFGCVPSKALLHVAKKIASIKKAESLGVQVKELSVDFSKVMKSVHDVRQKIYEEADSPDIMQERGVEIIEGNVTFKDDHSIEVSGKNGTNTFSFRSAIITAGGSPLVIPIKGLDEIPYLTNETIFELTKQPKHLTILGSGPIGVEMAQAFTLLGSKVTVIALDPQILIRDEPKCTQFVKDKLEGLGVTFHLEQTIHNIYKKNSKYQLDVGPLPGKTTKIITDALLIAVGRKPNLENLNLQKAGVTYDKQGIPVDRYCRTNVKHIFACGDITTWMKFTHVAENMAKAAAINATFKIPMIKYEQDVVPWVTYTDPECAHVGKTASELESGNAKFDTIELPYSKIDRAVTEHEEEGLVMLHTSGGKILGAHVVGYQAGELINEYTLAMKNRLKLSKIADTIHAYPSMLLGARRAADQYYVRLQKKWMSRLVKFLFRYKGEIPDYIGSKTVL